MTRRNMRALQAILLHCPCGALAQYSAALRPAKAEDREEVIPGDGYAAPAHRAKPRNRLRFEATQVRWREDVAVGRPVVAWPETRSQIELQVISPNSDSEPE